MTLIRNGVFAHDHVKLKSLGWALIQYKALNSYKLRKT